MRGEQDNMAIAPPPPTPWCAARVCEVRDANLKSSKQKGCGHRPPPPPPPGGVECPLEVWSVRMYSEGYFP
eukprot:CAMPEP_0180640120 /NCGR_PEP_ID=MMETSP1037_2-20121125/45527_1 /TAXON_ID=632150 /ORGANISM="Azadinium spinosum, Strain 3D9" /LENGTH=70 /DNA_ID=CAMNT_0022662371 /DNA_START=6 /DNA_END=218 /DNA_ORIENTATION=-